MASKDQQRRRSAGDTRNLLGDDTGSQPSQFSRASEKAARKRAVAKTIADLPMTRAAAVAEAKQVSKALSDTASRQVFFDLAQDFLDQPWVHAYRGDTKPLPTLRVGLGVKLIAKLISERYVSDERMDDWDDERIAEVIGYAMKHFFAQVPNDERDPNNILRRFLHDDWWWHLINEAIDHFKMSRAVMPTWEESQQRSEDFYAKWPMKTRPTGPVTDVRVAAARFNEVYTARMAAIDAADSITEEEYL